MNVNPTNFTSNKNCQWFISQFFFTYNHRQILVLYVVPEAYSGGLLELSPPWTSEIYLFQGDAPTGAEPPLERNFFGPPGQIPGTFHEIRHFF